MAEPSEADAAVPPPGERQCLSHLRKVRERSAEGCRQEASSAAQAQVLPSRHLLK
ncbi:unnamed protein product [Linum tenue]|uniref:Uncharacterized protein n=1 Tax=Linum tenue TaxID=586396 RepID=A0AAV0NV27_9ROSI|nr:unnamed protein product [Linum tenue]